MNLCKAEIGISFIASYSVPASVYWIGVFLCLWHGNSFFALFANRAIMLLLLILTVAGIIMYIAGRNKFLDQKQNRRITLPLMMNLGLILIVEGIFFSIITGLGPEKYEWTLKSLLDFSLYVGWYLSRIFSGLLFLIDGFRTRANSKSCALMLIILGAITNPLLLANSNMNNHVPGVYNGRYFWDSPPTHYPQPYMAGYMDTSGYYFYVKKTNVTISFPDTNASVIQEDNWLAGGMFVVGYDKKLVQIDYGFYTMLVLDHNENLYINFGVIETYECLPYWPYICPFGLYPWIKELFSHTIPVNGISPSTPTTLVASWDPSHSGLIQWNYTVNNITYPAGAVNITALAPTIIPTFVAGSRNLTFNWFIDWNPYWQTYPFQFGITSSYTIGHGGWNVLLSNPSYFKEGKWHNVETARIIGGTNAILDTRWIWGGENYEGVTAHNCPSLQTYSLKFYYSGSTARDHTILWESSQS